MKTYLSILMAAFTILASGCGNDPSMYRGETLTFQSPVSAQSEKVSTTNSGDLDLAEEESSDFLFTRIGALVPMPYPLYPLYDYYLDPIPVEIPVSPFYSVVEYLPPMYWNYYFNPYYADDDE